MSSKPIDRTALNLQLVAECRQTFGVEAARRLWRDLDLQAVETRDEARDARQATPIHSGKTDPVLAALTPHRRLTPGLPTFEAPGEAREAQRVTLIRPAKTDQVSSTWTVRTR